MRRPDTGLVVFCRQPRLGVGKQRLAADLGAAAAARVATALWDCVLEDLALWHGTVVLAVAEPAEESWAQTQLRSLPSRIATAEASGLVLIQPAGNLGNRLNAIDRELRRLGLERLLYIGSDAPVLDAAALYDLAGLLEGADVVLAPAEDGGVVAMGSNLPWPPLAALPWSTSLLGRTLADCCVAAGRSVSIGAGSWDVDEQGALLRSAQALRQDARPGRRRLVALIDELHPARLA